MIICIYLIITPNKITKTRIHESASHLSSFGFSHINEANGTINRIRINKLNK